MQRRKHITQAVPRSLRLTGTLGLTVLSIFLWARASPSRGGESEMLSLVNQARADSRYRAETGGRAAPLDWSDAVAAVAQRHADEMARTGVLSHAGADGANPGVRLDRAGVAWSRVGENVGMAGSLEEIHAMFMREPAFEANHRGNILDRNFTRIGIGVARSPNGEIFAAEDFYTPPA